MRCLGIEGQATAHAGLGLQSGGDGLVALQLVEQLGDGFAAMIEDLLRDITEARRLQRVATATTPCKYTIARLVAAR
jgi:hypothetical protein